MKRDVYEKIPVLENDKFILRAIDAEPDTEDLLKVYSDEKALPLFNSDNCQDNFHYTTLERMKQAIEFWKFAYEQRGFVRWAIVSKCGVTTEYKCGEETDCNGTEKEKAEYNHKKVIGTIELFNRRAEDCFNNCGLLRLDLRSDYETTEDSGSILGLIVPKIKELFDCDKIATKAVACAKSRICALEQMGFHLSENVLTGHDGKTYDSYFVKLV